MCKTNNRPVNIKMNKNIANFLEHEIKWTKIYKIIINKLVNYIQMVKNEGRSPISWFDVEPFQHWN